MSDDGEGNLSKVRYSAEVERTLSYYRKYQGGAATGDGSTAYKIRYDYALRFTQAQKDIFDAATARGASDQEAYELATKKEQK